MNTEPVIARLEQFEGRINYMYRCTGGEVTIGVGHAILTVADALKLQWQQKNSTERPTDAVIAIDYRAVENAPKGQVAGKYADLTLSRMNDEAIDQLLESDIMLFGTHLNRLVPGWSSDYPENAQEALFDMAYNLGLGGLAKYHKLLNACAEGDWVVAAAESYRNGIDDDRNKAIRQLFLSCAASEQPA